MKISRIKAVTIFAVILMITSSLTIFASIQPAKAATLTTHAFISAVPNPIGVGQSTAVYFWLAETIQNPSAGVGNNNRFRNYTLTIINPDGTMMAPQDDLARALNVTVAQPYVFDTTSSSSYYFTPAVTGDYRMIFQYKGQGNYYAPGVTGNNFYLPSNVVELTLHVQDEPIPAADPSYPLPEEYWTRPIFDENVDWFHISSNWLNSVRDRNQGGIDNNRFQPDGIASNTAHVMWANPLIGQTDASYVTSMADNPLFQTQFIMQGLLYIPLPPDGWRIVDVRSGSILYEVKSGSNTPTFGYYRDSDHYNQHGVMWGGVLYGINQTSPTTQTWFGYKTGNPSGAGGTYNISAAIPFTGSWNLTNVPMGYEMVDTKGATLRALVANANLTVPDWRVRLWNDSLGLSGDGTPSGNINASTNFAINVPVENSAGNPVILQDDTVPVSANIYYTEFYPNRVTGGVLLCRNGTLPTQTTNQTSKYTYFAISLYNQTINGLSYNEGQIMWMKSYETAADAGVTLLQGPSYYPLGYTPDAAQGAVWTMVEKETGTWTGYSIFNGDKIWTSEPQTKYSAYGFTQPTERTGATVSVAYGKLFTTGDSGIVFAYDIQTGDLLWRSEAKVPYAATVTNYPTHIGAIADGKIYLGTYPLADSTLLSGGMVRCLNVTDGSEIWALPGFGGPGGYAISDGYVALLNYYDMKVYSIGRGPSAITTGTATARVSHMGEKVTITGSVLDNSPNPQINNTPAISDADMSAWMAYIYQGQAKPHATGVTVTISVNDPNGNTYDIGTAVSNSDGEYSFEWSPEVSGEYQIIAKFDGTNSYYPSLAHSAVYIEDALPTPTPSVTPPPSMTGTYLLASTLAIIVALIIAGAIVIMTLKKRHA